VGPENSPLVERPGSLEIFRDLFCSLYGLDEPVLPLRNVAHWYDRVRSLGSVDHEIHTKPTAVMGGWFYNISTPAPSRATLESWLAEAQSKGVSQGLVPTVRRQYSAEALAEAGFVGVPWFIEAECTIQEGLDKDLRARLGRDRHDGIRRIARRAEKLYPATYHRGTDLGKHPELVESVAGLHACNVRKYGHAANFYDAALLRRLIASPLGEHVLVCIRRQRGSERAVQASISLLDRDCGQLYWLAVGIDHDQVDPSANLFVADGYGLARLAEREGATTVNLGRGNPTQKRRLGADRFYVLQNWIRADSPSATAELLRLKGQMNDSLGLTASGSASVGQHRFR
jgi:hypothetical protein